VEPELVQRYVEDGTLKMEWRDFAYLGQESVNAALAARAAQKQGKFWEYHDALYANQGSINGGTFSDEKLTDLARQVGLDAETFESDFTSRRFEQVVQSDFREGQNAGIQATPSFNINGQMLVGPQPLEAFEQVIEEELRKAEDEAENG
jgi:protein-disulfide isomerase